MPRTTTRRVTGTLLATAVALLLAGCSQPPPPPTPEDTVAFSATGPAGEAFGSYTVTGPLASTSMQVFDGLPFSATTLVPRGTATPAMQVSLVGARPGSRLSCRITVNGRVIAASTVQAPGTDARCVSRAASR